MGVRGLQTFVEKECPETCKTVSIQQLADSHKMEFGSHSVIVVDGNSMTNHMYRASNLEWIYGGQWLQFVNFLENLIEKFKIIGVELIFFFDGTVCVSKMEEWARRRISKYETIATIFNFIKNTYNEPNLKDFMLPTSMGLITAFALKSLGAKVYQTDREADDVIAEYAYKCNEVFAILSQDSDFIIYNTKPYLSLSHLDVDTLQTFMYDRNRLASHYLKLNLDQLRLFACLVGNDFVPNDKLKPFHRRLLNNGRVYFAALAPELSRFIQIQQWSGNPANDRELLAISQVVFGNSNWANHIRDGLNSYIVTNPTPLPPEVCVSLSPFVEQAVYDRHLSCSNPYIFNILCKMEYRSSEVLEDAFIMPSAIIYREIRQRCYGVLFNCFSHFTNPEEVKTKYGEPVLIREWCAYHSNNLERPEFVKPLPLNRSVFLSQKIPSIEDLWCHSTEIEKMKAFWAIMQIPLEFDLLLTLPKNRIVFACILSFLIGGSMSGTHLKAWEVAVFVAQAVCRKSVEELEELVVPWVDAAAVNLSTLFMRGVSTVLMVLGICDNPVPITYVMPWHFFDGKLFHYLYTNAQRGFAIHDLCMNQKEAIAEFYKLLRVVTNNTIYDVNTCDWSSIFTDFDFQCL